MTKKLLLLLSSSLLLLLLLILFLLLSSSLLLDKTKKYIEQHQAKQKWSDGVVTVHRCTIE